MQAEGVEPSRTYEAFSIRTLKPLPPDENQARLPISPRLLENAPFIAVFDSVERFRDSTDLFPLFIPFGTNLQLGRGFVPATGFAPESAYLKEYAVLLELRGLIPAYLHRLAGLMGIKNQLPAIGLSCAPPITSK